MSLEDADIVIAGAGASGLSLALMLGEKAPHLSLLLLEPRAAHTNDRTFCFFRTTPHRFSALVSRSFREIEVRSEVREVRRPRATMRPSSQRCQPRSPLRWATLSPSKR